MAEKWRALELPQPLRLVLDRSHQQALDWILDVRKYCTEYIEPDNEEEPLSLLLVNICHIQRKESSQKGPTREKGKERGHDYLNASSG